MLERLKSTFSKAEPASLKVSSKEGWDSELRTEAYLDSLDEISRRKVDEFSDFSRRLQDQLRAVQIAVTAVGSSTVSEERRHHPVEDVDLRILNSAPPHSMDRSSAILSIREGVRGYLMKNGDQFVEDNSTLEERLIKGKVGGRDTLIPFVSWYNDDPSFLVQGEGLPLHISISGIDNYELDRYLGLESKKWTSAVLLVKPK